MNGLQLALSVNWAMSPDAVERLLAVADRQGEWRHLVGPDGRLDTEAVAAQNGKPLKGTQRVNYRQGPDGKKVAVVPFIGPAFRRANLMTEMSGATSFEVFATDFNAALSDPTVKGIVLEVDSPGGEINGTHETARMIAAARGQKPIVSYVGGMGASAAYFVASAADRVVIDAMSEIGSIGVVARARKNSEDGTITITSTQSPYKRVDPGSKEGQAKIQAEIDAMANVFIDSVAEFRGVSRDKVLKDFGRGGIKIGKDAVIAGMADGLGSLEGVIAQLMALEEGGSLPTQTAKPGKNTMNWKSFLGLLSDEEKAEAKAELDGVQASTVVTAPAINEELLAEIAELRAKEALRAEKDAARAQEADEAAKVALTEEAKEFALNAIASNKILPASASLIEAQYLAASASGNVADFKALVDSMATLPSDPAKEEGAEAADDDASLAAFVLPSQTLGADEAAYDEEAILARFKAERERKAKAGR